MIHDQEILDIDFLRSYYIDLDVVDEIYNTAINEKEFSQPGLSGGKIQPEVKSSFAAGSISARDMIFKPS